jgi:hypothetical protein
LQAADHLSAAEQQLNTLLKAESVLKSVLAYLQIEKASIRGNSLQSQAAETAAIYHNLSRMLQPVAERRQSETTLIPQ